MSRIVLIMAIIAIATTIGAPQATAGAGNGYNHDFNWLRDADGDGIPNCLDEDWVCPEDGTGYQLRYGYGYGYGYAFGNNEDATMNQHQYRHRKNNAEGDCDGNQSRLRDGSCK